MKNYYYYFFLTIASLCLKVRFSINLNEFTKLDKHQRFEGHSDFKIKT